MKVNFLACMFIITCALHGRAQVIDYEIDDSFNSELLFNRGSVSDILHTEIDTYMIMGMFSTNTSSPLTAGAMITTTGNLFHSQSIGGMRTASYKHEYLQYGQGIRRFNIPGGTNQVFRFEFQKPAYTGPLSNVARDAMVMPDDHILVAGRFFTDSTLMGTSIASQGLRQLCMINSTGAPVPGFPMLRCEQPVDAEIYSIRQLSTGQYIITGRFSEVDGHATNSMARLHEDFSVDTTFVSPLMHMKVVIVNHLDSQDRMWTFIERGQLNTNPNDTIWGARILPDGQVDPSFNIPQMFAQVTANQPSNNGTFPTFIGRVHEDSDGTFIITGNFTLYNGISRKGIAKICDDGSLVPGVFDNWGADEAVWGNHTYHPSCGVYPLPDGKLMIGGRFSSFGGEPYSCLVRLQPNGFVGTDDREGRGALKLYPNPARHHFRIELPEGVERFESVELYDMQGRAVHTWSVAQSQFATEGLPAGMYVVRVSSVERVYTQKLILEP